MKSRLLIIFVTGLLLIPFLWVLMSNVSIEEVVPAKTGALVRVDRPMDLAEKIVSARFVQDLAKQPKMDVLAALLSDWSGMRNKPTFLTAVNFFLKAVYVSAPSDLTRYGPMEMPFTTYFDLGLLGRAFSLMSTIGTFGGMGQVSTHRGHKVYVKNNVKAAVFFRNMMIQGPQSGVLKALDAYHGGGAALDEHAERYRRVVEMADQQADLQLMILSRSLFRPAEETQSFLDPRKFLSPAAIDGAALNAYFDDDGISVKMEIAAVPGKSVSPYTLDKPQQFATRFLPDEGTTLYAAMRVERPAALGNLLYEYFSGDQQVKKFRQKLVMLMLNTFLEYAGNELAVLVDENVTGLPTVVFEMRDPEKITQLLDKTAQSEQARANALNLPVREDGQTLADSLAKGIPDEELDKLLQLVPADQRDEIKLIAKMIKDGLINADEVTLDNKRIGLFGRAMYWRVQGNHLILAPTPVAAERYRLNLQAQKMREKVEQAADAVPLDGPWLFWINLSPLLEKIDALGEEVTSWLTAKHPQIVVGSAAGSDRLTLVAKLPFDLGITNVKLSVSEGWTALLFAVQALFVLIAVVLAVVFLRALFQLMWRRDSL